MECLTKSGPQFSWYPKWVVLAVKLASRRAQEAGSGSTSLVLGARERRCAACRGSCETVHESAKNNCSTAQMQALMAAMNQKGLHRCTRRV
jgi:hypothetical protein